MINANVKKGGSFLQRLRKERRTHPALYLLMIPFVLYYILFDYVPMYGVIIAFQDYNVVKGIGGSDWVGLYHFEKFLNSYYFDRLVGNTLAISLLSLIFSFPMPILLALSLNEVRSNPFRRTIQTLSYLPHFISTVVVCGIIRIFFDKDGIMTQVLTLFGMPNRNLLVYPQYFRGIYIGTGIWQSMGWSSIIYIAALSGVSPELYEAATIDGAGRFQKMWHVSIPAILPTIVTMFILNCGRLMSVGYEKIMLLYNENTYKTADVISTYVYRYGLGGSFEYSYTTAISIFTSIVNVVLLTCSNFLSNKLSGYGLW